MRNEKYTIEAFVNNVTDDDTLLAALPGVDLFAFGVATLPGNFLKNEFRFSAPLPRAYGVRFGYNF